MLEDLKGHVWRPDRPKGDSGKCLVRVAETYLSNNQDYMRDYVEFMIANLPVGSGEAESGIRHVIKRRMHVAGAWEESNAGMMLALLAIRASGWWAAFWAWRSERDKAAWRQRRECKVKVLFRSKRGRAQQRAAA